MIATTCENPEVHGLLGHSQWSASLLAQVLKLSGRVGAISSRTVQRILRGAAIKLHRIACWKQPIDPNFEAKMRPVIELYINPPG